MKKTLAILATFVVAVGAFAQGKVTFGNDANHLIVFGAANQIVSASARDYSALAGLALPQLGTAQNTASFFTASLWAGTAAGSLSLVATQAPVGIAGNPDGRLVNQTVILPNGMPAGTEFFQIQVWETAGVSYNGALSGGYLTGVTPVFQATSGSFAYNFLSTAPGWTAGPITLSVVPEPSTFALAGLGVASLLLFRRRKS